MRRITASLSLAVLAIFATSFAQAAEVGWQTELATHAHNVSGTVTILDEDTIQVDDFTYDGGGLSVYFYLGEEDTSTAFLNGLAIGNDIVHISFDGTQEPMVINLPGGETLADWSAISVWCVTAHANFGSGTFAAVSGPLLGDYNDDGILNAADYTFWRNAVEAGDTSLPNEDPSTSPGAVDQADYLFWRDHYGETLGSGSSDPLSSVPEPCALTLALCELLAVAPYVGRRHA